MQAIGGGGAVWDSLVYDPDLDRVIFGTGNAAPYLEPGALRGLPQDRLYAASIIALDADSGRMAWYYQTTPGDIWDFDAAASRPRGPGDRRTQTQDLMQANKNGYFYVLDRQSGRPISATPYRW